MTPRAIFHAGLGATAALLLGAAATAHAWTDKFDDAEMVPVCKFEPEGQCSWGRFMGADLAGRDMHDLSAASIRLDGANLQGANLENAILQLANLKGANLMVANLQNAHLHGVNLQNANLMMANLKKVNLLDADLTGANLRGANLDGAIIIKARFDNATWPDGRVCAKDSIGECL